jgi:triosephosphate isomerase (TIM)
VRYLFVANWKMNKTSSETNAFFDAFLPLVASLPDKADVAIAPPFTSLATAAERLKGTRIALGAQTMHWELQGAYTGEISAPMLIEAGVSYVILGHSERRAYFNETDHTVNLKVKTALELGLTPIVAVGETLDEHERGLTDDRVITQVRAAFDGVARSELIRTVIAYEPIWAIGTGKTCPPSEADRVMSTIRGCISGLDETRMLYGGSMKPDNVPQIVERPHVNGGLVGGASLDPYAFAQLIRNAAV